MIKSNFLKIALSAMGASCLTGFFFEISKFKANENLPFSICALAIIGTLLLLIVIWDFVSSGD